MRFFGKLFTVVVVVTLGAVWSKAGGGTRDSAWEALVARDPGVVDDERVGWEERVALHALTRAQAAEYRRGVDPGRLILADGRTLGEYLEARLAPTAGVYVGLSAPCSLFSGEWWPSGVVREVAVRGFCGVPEEALAAVLELRAEAPSPTRTRVKVWARDLPEPAGAALEGDPEGFATSLRTTTIVNLCAGEPCDADLRFRSAADALLEARVVGYFRPLLATDNPTPVVSFFTEGASNNFFGTQAGASNTGSANSFFGAYAGRDTTTGSDNSFFGRTTGLYNQTGSSNSFFGRDAGRNNNGWYNSFFGANAGYANTTGGNNAFFGQGAGRHNTAGFHNSFFGASAAFYNTEGNNNAVFGYYAGFCSQTGGHNAFFGYYAGYANTTGGSNSSFGQNAGRSNTTGYNNAFFGSWAGSSNTTEDRNSFLGARSNGAAGITNATALGYRAQVSQSNSLVLGSIAGLNEAAGQPHASVNVGIGTPAPQRQLHLKGSNAVFRMDRDSDTAAFMIVRTDGAGAPLKTFVVGTNAFAPGNGEFVVNDLGAAVGGPGVRRMTITNSGETHFTGTVRAPSVVQTSSLRFKANVETLRNAPEVVERLRGVSFIWRETGKPSVGLIAEEVAEVIPEVVEWEENGLEAAGINYAALAAVLVEALKSQRREIESLQSRHTEIEALRAELAGVRSELRALRAATIKPAPKRPHERETDDR